MKILLTNDDGFDAPGIQMLKEQLDKVGEVFIVAPTHCMSAKSVSLTIGKSLHIKEEAKNVYSVDGFPADCVALAIEYFKVEKGIEWNDKDISNALLTCLKNFTKNYAVSLTEASNDNLYNVYKRQFDELSQLQRETFEMK